MYGDAHVSFDLETFGTSSDAVIVAIGAVEFDPYSNRLGKEFYCNVEAASCISAGMKIDASAIYFWLDQLKERQNDLKENRLSIGDALSAFRKYMEEVEGRYVWAHATFDPVIVANACTLANKGRIFNYKDVRDLRTLTAITRDYSQCPLYSDAKDMTMAHNALADAVRQAKVVQWCFKKIMADGIA